MEWLIRIKKGNSVKIASDIAKFRNDQLPYANHKCYSVGEHILVKLIS